MQQTLKVLSYLLDYPQTIEAGVVDEMAAILAQAAGLGDLQAPLQDFLVFWGSADRLDLQALYGSSFERGRQCALYLYEHRYGDSRERGPAMVDLEERYRACGLQRLGVELPDYLPCYLEYCALLPLAQGQAALAEIIDVLRLLQQGLQRRQSPFGIVVQALLRLADAREVLGGEDLARDDDAAAIDQAWAEVPVDFSSTAWEACHQAAAGRPAVSAFPASGGSPS